VVEVTAVVETADLLAFYLYHSELKLKTVFLKLVAEGLIGMAIVGGAAAIAIGGLVGLGVALSKK